MSDGLPCTFYLYLPASSLYMPEWAYNGDRTQFYRSFDVAREAINQLKSDVAQDTEYSWKPIHLFKIEISAITTDAVLVFLDEGISKLGKSYQILETIDHKD